jgi:hypothetical protein
MLALFLSVLPVLAAGDDAAPPATLASPIFGQLVMFTLPTGFVTISEQSSLDRYIRKAALKGETVDKWSQMITVTGARGLATKPEMSAQYFAAQIAAGFQKSCPATFSVKPLGQTSIGGQDSFIAVASCGKLDASPDKHAETTLVIAIKEASDVYTIQWTERTPANAENLTIDEAKWKDRLDQLAPIRLCEIKPGEKPPYPSCPDK